MAEERAGAPLRPGFWLTAGVILLALSILVAAAVERAGGISVRDVRFTGPDGTSFGALLYRPKAATPEHPAPGVLAVHGYINTRETQSAFAIEFARRGYVVLALDQRGHGTSGGAATGPRHGQRPPRGRRPRGRRACWAGLPGRGRARPDLDRDALARGVRPQRRFGHGA